MSWRDAVRPELLPLAAYQVPSLPARIKLDANESPYVPPPELLAAIAEELPRQQWNRYPDRHALRLRTAVARDLGVAPTELLFGNGSDELIGLLCQTFAARPAIVYPAPSFVVYRTAAAGAGLRAVEAPLGSRFAADGAALERAIAEARPSLVFVATPNNPTGTEWPRAVLEEIVAAHPDTVFVLDEAYCAYARTSLLELVAHWPHCAVLRTYSKIGLAGLRVGVLIAQEPLIAEVDKVRPPYNLGALPQLAAALALERFRSALFAHVEEIIAERERLAQALSMLPGVEVFPSSANLLLIRVRDAARIWQSLVDRGVLVRNLDRPGPLAGCLRITVGTPDENREFLASLRSVV